MKKSVVSARLVRMWLPKRSSSAHKGSVGRVFIVAGSRGFIGAAAITTLGAVRSGAGLVQTAVPRSLQAQFVKIAPVEATSQSFPVNKKGQFSKTGQRAIFEALKKYQARVVAVGPGLGLSGDTKSLVRSMFESFSGPLVLDADAITLMAQLKWPLLASGPRVITPHPGELARLLSWTTRKVQSHRAEAVLAGARKIHGICLLKGQETLISDGSVTWMNPTGNPKMASGGMGDLLTGMIASLWAQLNDSSKEAGFRAAVIAAYWHGMAGDLAARRISGLSVTATDVARFLPAAFKKFTR